MCVGRRQFQSIHQPSLQPIDQIQDSDCNPENKNVIFNNPPFKSTSSSLPKRVSKIHSFSSSNKFILVPNYMKAPQKAIHGQSNTSQKNSPHLPLSSSNSRNNISPTFNSTPRYMSGNTLPSISSCPSDQSIPQEGINKQSESSNFTDDTASLASEDLNQISNPETDEKLNNKQPIESSDIQERSILTLEEKSLDQKTQLKSNKLKTFEDDVRQKLAICSKICDFTLQKSNMSEKELKSHTLFELVDLFEHSSQIQYISEELQEEVLKMIEVNIFNPNRIRTVTISDYLFTFLEPSWSHLFYCYQVFNKFLILFPNSKLVNRDLMKRILLLMELPDNNERIQLVSLIRTYYETHPNERIFILKSVESLFIDLLDDQVTHFCAMPLLQLSAYMFSRSRNEYSDYFNRLIRRSIIPLIGLKFLPFFQQSLKNFISVVLTAYPSMALEHLRGIEIRWSVANGTKQQQILEILIIIFSKMPQEAFKPISRRVFKFLSDCVLSNHSKLCEEALDIWTSADDKNWVGLNCRIGIKEMYENVATISEKHWNSQTSTKANSALLAMNKLNKNVFQKIKLYYKQLKSQKFREKPPNITQKGWNLIAQTASSTDANFDLNEKIDEIRELFHNEKRPTLEISRFIPAKRKDIEEAKKIAKQ